MSRNRIADLQLRGSTSPLPVRVYWPAQAASQPVPLLVFCIVGAGAGPRADTTCRSLSEDPGLVVLAVSCLAGAQDGMTVLEWAAEHAAELGADPGRLLIAGQDAGLVVLSVFCAGGSQDETNVLEWAAEHAAELGADPGRLLIAGEGGGGRVARAGCRLACRDAGGRRSVRSRSSLAVRRQR